MKIKILSLLICSIFLLIGSLPFVDAQTNDVVIIVNAGVSINKVQAQQVFTGVMKTLPGAGAAKVLFNANAALNEAFARKYLGMSADRLESTWVTINVRDGIPAPRKVPSAVVKSLVAGSPVFIGFVNRSEADSSVKIIE